MESTPSARWSRPRTVALLLALFVLLHAPSLGWGFFADDFAHRLALERPFEHPTLRPWSLYDFGDAASTQEAFFEDAFFPWWTDEDWQGRFFRPLTSLSLWLDHTIWGRSAPGHHATSLLLHGLFLALLLRLYRAAGLHAPVAALAVALVALEDGSALVVGWIANRNSILEGIFTAAAIGTALRARERGGTARFALALALSALALASKESGVAAPAACVLLWWRSPRPGSRVASATAALLAAGFVAFLAAEGYGVKSLFYPTPWREPLLWGKHLGVMLVAGAVSLLGPFPVDLLSTDPRVLWPGLALAMLVLFAMARPWARAARATPGGRFFAAFALLALLPQASAPPSDRLLFVPAIGVAPITATWLATALRPGSAVARGARRLAWAVAIAAIPLSGTALLLRGASFVPLARLVREVVLSAELERRPPARRDVLILQAPSVIPLLGPLAMWRFETGDMNTRFHALQFGRRALRWTRLDERSFELESLDEPFLSSLFERVFLTTSQPFRPGERRGNSAFEAELLECEPGGVRRFRVRCDKPLESLRYVFLAWREGRLRRIAPPPPGESVALERCASLGLLVP